MKAISTSENSNQLILEKWEKEVIRLVQLLQAGKQTHKTILEQSKVVDKLRIEANQKLCDITCA